MACLEDVKFLYLFKTGDRHLHLLQAAIEVYGGEREKRV